MRHVPVREIATAQPVMPSWRSMADIRNGKAAFNRSAIMQRAWLKAQHNYAADRSAGDYSSGYSLLDWFRDALREQWEEARRVVLARQMQPAHFADPVLVNAFGF